MAIRTIRQPDHSDDATRQAAREKSRDRAPQTEFLVADTPTPPVDVTELRRYRELLESLAAELDVSTDGDEKLKGSIAAFGLQKVVEGVCGSGANAQALWLRNGLLEMFLREGYLAPLRSCTELANAVLQVAATIPFDGQDLKPQTFVRRLREARRIDVAGSADRQFAASGNEADRCRRLQHHYRLMNVDTQQLEYENRVISTDLATARSALAILSEQQYALEPLKVVQDALNELSQMSESEQFGSFMQGVEEGAPIPPVDPIDLRHLQELYEQVDRQCRDAGMKGSSAIDGRLLANVCTPGADVGAVWVRSALLGSNA